MFAEYGEAEKLARLTVDDSRQSLIADRRQTAELQEEICDAVAD